MLTLKEMYVRLNDGWHPAEQCADISVELRENGLYLEADQTPVWEVKLVWNEQLPDDALVLGDAWERGYGNLAWEPKAQKGVLPWYFLSVSGGKTAAYGIKTQPNAMCYWMCKGENVTFHADVTSGNRGVRLCGRTLHIADFVFAEYDIDPLDAASDFCGEMCENPRLPEAPVYGGNDWYCCYGENSYDSIMEHARKIAECAEENENPPYMVIDDGWQICHHNGNGGTQYFNGGPWNCGNSRFGDMKKMAADISALGLKPGIWIRPLYTTEDFPVGDMLKIESTMYTMDPTVPWVLEQVKTDIATLRDWGFKLIKHDFSSFDLFEKWGMDNDAYLCVMFITQHRIIF